jgi:hypothetical protein
VRQRSRLLWRQGASLTPALSPALLLWCDPLATLACWRSSTRVAESWSVGWVVQMLNDWGVDRTLTRKLMQALGSMGPAACLFALAADQGADRAWVHQACAVL